MSYLVEYKCDVCCFTMNDVQWIQFLVLVPFCAIFNKNTNTNEFLHLAISVGPLKKEFQFMRRLYNKMNHRTLEDFDYS